MVPAGGCVEQDGKPGVEGGERAIVGHHTEAVVAGGETPVDQQAVERLVGAGVEEGVEGPVQDDG
jgi:hypothetical protein